jgi:folate-binding protein YgfZ
MTALSCADLEIYRLATEEAALFDLSRHGLITCSGKDSAQFLHNLCTNEVVKLPVGAASEAFLTTAQAKVVDHVWILHTTGIEPTYLVDVGDDEGPRIFKHLDRFLISEQLELLDLCGAMIRYHLAGPRSGNILGKATGAELEGLKDLQSLDLARGESRLIIWRRNRLGVLGYDLILNGSDSAVWSPLFGELPVRSTESSAFECLRIEAGLPRFGMDITEANLPQEVGRIDQTISYTKGCYIGQETVARVRSFGHVNRALRGLLGAEKTTFQPGAKLYRDGQEVGVVTSGTNSPRRGRPIALAYVRRGHDELGTNLSLHADGKNADAVVADLPFVPFIPN